MGKRFLMLLFTAVIIGMLMAPTALAATPRDIYDDFMDNGLLDGTYTVAELRAYLNDATLTQYGNAAVKDLLDSLATQSSGRDSFPFTGFQVGLALAVAVALVGGGFGLHRLSRAQRS